MPRRSMPPQPQGFRRKDIAEVGAYAGYGSNDWGLIHPETGEAWEIPPNTRIDARKVRELVLRARAVRARVRPAVVGASLRRLEAELKRLEL